MSEGAHEGATEVEAAASDDAATAEKDWQAEAEKWQALSKKNEARAKENAAAAKRLADLEEAGKSEAEKAADYKARLDAAEAAVPSLVASALRDHLVALHKIEAEDAELFLTAAEPDLLLKQIDRLVARRTEDTKKSGNRAPLQGQTPSTSAGDQDMREFVRGLFDSVE